MLHYNTLYLHIPIGSYSFIMTYHSYKSTHITWRCPSPVLALGGAPCERPRLPESPAAPLAWLGRHAALHGVRNVGWKTGDLPSGKLRVRYGKSSFFMGKSMNFLWPWFQHGSTHFSNPMRRFMNSRQGAINVCFFWSENQGKPIWILDDYETIEYWMIISLKNSSIWQVGKFWESQISSFESYFCLGYLWLLIPITRMDDLKI